MLHTPSVHYSEDGSYDSTPTYLFDYADVYRNAPMEAAASWFKEARYGLGISLGLHALLGKGTDVQQEMKISRESYENLKDGFQAAHFDAMDLVQFVIANGMRYIECTIKGADGFCLWNTAQTDFNCVQSPTHRDLLAELASVCEFEGVGLCLRYSLGRDWRQQHSLASGEYFQFVQEQLKELLTQYGPIAAISFEGNGAAAMEAQQTEDHCKLIRNLQPQVLISCEGPSCNGDFCVCDAVVSDSQAQPAIQWPAEFPAGSLRQMRFSLTPGHWGYYVDAAGKHIKEEQVWQCLSSAASARANLLMHTNLMPDGSLDLEDMNTLLNTGKKIQSRGFPRN